jgi:D-tyrosyl-tRNA(Tyr) deacylase
MRAVLQRVSEANVKVDNNIIGRIEKGFVVLLGIAKEDNEEDIKYICEKIINLRVFEDEQEKMNLSVLDIKGELLIISQFTLYGDCRKGRRPGFDKAARPEKAKELYENFVSICKENGVVTKTGIFQADMLVDISNDGPVTLLLDSKKEF